MPRTKESTRLSSRTAREELPARHVPYWLVLEKGRAIGYRKGIKGGTWHARYHNAAGVPPTLFKTLVEMHYGHLCPTAKAEAVRKLAPVLGIFQPTRG